LNRLSQVIALLQHNMFSESLLRELHFFGARNILNSSLQISTISVVYWL
jgi:hypothetical protein